MRAITEEQKQKIVRMYCNEKYTLREIANLNDVGITTIWAIINEKEIEKRQHKKRPKRVYQKKGYPDRRKFNDEQEKQIAVDYYTKGLTNAELKAKYGINRATMQRIRNKYKSVYGTKIKGRPKRSVENEKSEN